MSNREELNNPEIRELSPEALELAAGGADGKGHGIRVTRNTKIYDGNGQALGTVCKGTIFENYTYNAAVDNLDFECYRVMWGTPAAYIPCDCAEII